MNNITLSIEDWTSHAKKHISLIGPFADAFVKRQSLGLSHAVHDFLFKYYNFSPLKLKQWVPSFEENLLINTQTQEEYPWLNTQWFCLNGNLLTTDRNRVQQTALRQAEFIAHLSNNILHRPPRFGCFGLHEWAMVYKLSSEELRHQNHQLRLSQDELARFVESQTICCSHYDAYRFFTKEAHPLNVLNPLFENRLDMEQGGCVHANMDIYKWAIKLWPWTGSDFIGKAFLLALEGRELDMRASPYDLSKIGYTPICIETEEGRKQYQKEQQLYADKSFSLREELLVFCKRFIHE